MSFFNFFRKRDQESQQDLESNMDIHNDDSQVNFDPQTPSEDLFVDNTPPEKTNEQSSELLIFLSRKYDTIGRTDGYFQHSHDYLEKAKKKLIGEFLLCIDYRLDELNDRLSKIKNTMIDIKNISQPTLEKLQNSVDSIQSQMIDLKKEKELAFDHGGMIYSVIAQYEAGYEQGMSDYVREEIFLNPLKKI